MLDHARQKHRHRVGIRSRLRPNRNPQTNVLLPKKSIGSSISQLGRKHHHRPTIKLPKTRVSTEKVNLILARSPRKTKIGLLIGTCVGIVVTIAVLNWVSPSTIADWGLPDLYAPLLLIFGLIWFCLARLVFVNPIAIAITFAPVSLLFLKLHSVVINWQVVVTIIALVVLFVLVSIIVRQLLIWAFD